LAVVFFGNPNPIFNGQPTSDPDAITRVVVPDSRSVNDALRDIAHADGLWRVHSAGQPSWVESNDPDLAEAIAQHYGCPIGRPTE
jgi:hypothetical protein